MVGGIGGVGGSHFLVVDDDKVLLSSLSRGLALEGIHVTTTTSAACARELARERSFDVAVLDLRIGDEWGLSLLRELRTEQPHLTTIVLSGYLSVPSAVEAVRIGADHVLVKPVTCKEIVRRVSSDTPDCCGQDSTPSLARAEWEHMMRVLGDCNGNVSEASRRLGLHRQNLQRRLRKDPPTH